jgi:hypothetical protein
LLVAVAVAAVVAAIGVSAGAIGRVVVGVGVDSGVVAVIGGGVAAIGVSDIVGAAAVVAAVVSVSDLELTLKSCVGIGSSWKYFAK